MYGESREVLETKPEKLLGRMFLHEDKVHPHVLLHDHNETPAGSPEGVKHHKCTQLYMVSDFSTGIEKV